MKNLGWQFYNKEFLESINLENISNVKSKEFIIARKKLLQSIKNYDNALFNYVKLSNQYVDELELKIVDTSKKITCIILTFNEERCINRCIQSVIENFDEIIIIDTGSTDSTIPIIEVINSSKIHLYHYKWDNNFANVRNFGIRKSTNDWLFFIDADEYLDKTMDYEQLHSLICGFDEFPLLNVLVLSPFIIEEQTHQEYEFVPRIIYKNNNLFFYGNVHEEIRSRKKEIIFLQINITLHHDGYRPEIKFKKDKINRNIDLLHIMLKKEPNNPRWINFFVRDGYEVVEDRVLENYITKALLLDVTQEIDINNLQLHEYTFNLLDYYCQLKFKQEDFTAVKKISEMLDYLIPENSNSFYYLIMVKYILLKKEFRKLLKETVLYKKNNPERQAGMMSTEGYHIDFLLALLLFETADYQKAAKYFEFLRGRLDTLQFERTLNTFTKMLNGLNS